MYPRVLLALVGVAAVDLILHSGSYIAPKIGMREDDTNVPAAKTGGVLYVIVTCTATAPARVPAILGTWASRVSPDDLLIVGGQDTWSDALRASVDPKYHRSLHTTDCPKSLDGHEKYCKEAMTVLLADKSTQPWVYVLDDDHYVLPENVAAFVADKQASKPVSYGDNGCTDHSEDNSVQLHGFCGGAGILLSRAAVSALAAPDFGLQRRMKDWVEKMLYAKMKIYDDIILAMVADKAGVVKKVIPEANDDDDKKTPFTVHPWRKFQEEPGFDFQDAARPMSYHYVTPDAMRVADRVFAQKYGWATPSDATQLFILNRSVAAPLMLARATAAQFWLESEASRTRLSEAPEFDWPPFPLGNSLMRYWDERGKALSQGQPFKCSASSKDELLKFAECDMPATKSSVSVDDCFPGCLKECLPYGSSSCKTGPWKLLQRSLIQQETQGWIAGSGLLKKLSAVSYSTEELKHTIGVHLRCDSYIEDKHMDYGILPFDFYTSAIREALEMPLQLRQVVLIYKKDSSAQCNQASAALQEELVSKFPALSVKQFTDPDAMLAWGLLNRASVGIGALSTFSLSALWSGQASIAFSPQSQGSVIAEQNDTGVPEAQGWKWVKTNFLPGKLLKEASNSEIEEFLRTGSISSQLLHVSEDLPRW